MNRKNETGKSLTDNGFLFIKRIALCCQSGADLNLCKTKIDLLMREISKGMEASVHMRFNLWVKLECELTGAIKNTCDPRYLSIILHARYRTRLYKRNSLKIKMPPFK